jgi:hypothetical protein
MRINHRATLVLRENILRLHVCPAFHPSPGSTQRLLGWVAVGAGAAALGVGFVFEVQRSEKLSERDSVCPSRQECTTDQAAQIASLTDDARSASTLGTVGLIAGGVLVAGGLTLVFTAPTRAPATTVSILPALAPGFDGVNVVGRIW